MTTSVTGRVRPATALVAVGAVVAALFVALIVRSTAAYAGSLSHGSLTMVSTRADGTSGPALPTTEGNDEPAISDDGKVIAFTSVVPAQDLVTDPAQVGHVTDTNDADDVFVWDSRIPAPVGPIVTLVSWNASHSGTGDAASVHPIMAPEGLGLVFQSSATDLTTTPVGSFSKHLYAWIPVVNEATPVFMVDVNYQGQGSSSLADDASVAVSLTPPSARVAFHSLADDLVDPMQHKADGLDQVYVRTYTLPSPSTQMVSLDSDGQDGTASGATEPEISADGNHVVFTSGGDDLIGTTDPNGSNIYERNLLTDKTTLVSADPGGDPTTGNNSPVVSADGSEVAWDDNDHALAPTTSHPDNVAHVFYRNGSAPVQLVDTDYTGLIGCDNASNWPGISQDGTMVVFESFCDDIVDPAHTASGNQVYARRMAPALSVPALPDPAPVLVSATSDGNAGSGDAFICSGNEPPQCGASTDPSVVMNVDGTAITFFSASDNLDPVPNPPPPNVAAQRIFVRYPDAPGGGKTVNLTTNALGQNPDGDARDPVMAADGGSVAFVSLADDMVTPDTNDSTDIFKSDIHNNFYFQPINPVNEGDGHVTITVARTGNLGTTDSVEVKTGDGSTPDLPILPPEITDPANSNATAPADYTATDETLTFPPGVATMDFQVPIVDDNIPEGPEIFHVSLSSESGAGSVALPSLAGEAYVVILDNDTPQDWHLSTTQQPPASAHVGDTVTAKATISVDAGANDLSVTGLNSGAGTSGLDSVDFSDSTPFTVAAGTSKEVTATARVTAAPGSTTSHLEFSVDGTLGADSATKTTDSDDITSTGAVTATLTGAPATAGLPDQITYTLTLANASDTAAEVTVPDADFTAPAGTTQSTRSDGDTTVAAHGQTQYQLSVDVDDSDTDGTVLTEQPTGVEYAMSAVGLAPTPLTVAPQSTTVQAPVVAVSDHTVTDHDGGALLPGDTVDVSVKVGNSGTGDTSGTFDDSLVNLQSPTDVQLDGVACADCTIGTNSVDTPLDLAAGTSHVLTYSATVPPGTASGAAASSNVTVTFMGGTTGTSPTPNDAATLTVGSTNVQDWSVEVTQQPPATAHVGDTVTVKAKVTVDPGPDDLSITAVSGGAGSVGFDQFSSAGTPPIDVAAGGTTTITATARVVATPGTGGVHLQLLLHGALGGGTPADRLADTDDVTVDDAVTATLAGGPATVLTTDQITYTLTATNASDTDAQLDGLPAGFTAPTGTTQASRTDGSTTVPAHGTSVWSLTVDVDDADTDGMVLTQLPSATYGMSDVGLSGQALAITPSSVTSAVSNPPVDNTPPDVTVDKAAGQDDPTSNSPIHFTATFSEPVTGFDSSDVDLSASSAGGVLVPLVTGGPSTYDIAVSGMTISGDVTVAIPAGAAFDAAHNGSTASTAIDNTVAWVQLIGSHVGIGLTPPTSVYGQGVSATATVTVDSGIPAGDVQFMVDGTDVGSAVPVGPGGIATSGPLTGPGGVALEPGSRHVSAQFQPSDPSTYNGSTGTTDLVVGQASSVATLAVSAHALDATVAAGPPGAGTPTGLVTFSVDGTTVGTASLSAGTAHLAYTTPSGKTHSVAATYPGDTHFTASSVSTSRHDPTITAKLTSAHPRTKYGWYRSPVTVAFTCTIDGSVLTNPCPSAVTLHKNGAAQAVSRTIMATDGGAATVTVKVNLDGTAPTVKVKGVLNGGRYTSPGPHLTCAGSDALSGLATCAITKHAHTSKGTTTVAYTATGTDRAGNRHSVSGTYQLAPITLAGASFTNGLYTVHRKHTYALVVHSSTRPSYIDAAPYPMTPFHPDPIAMHRAGPGVWSLPVTMTASLRSHLYWNIGIRIAGVLHVLKIRVVA